MTSPARIPSGLIVRAESVDDAAAIRSVLVRAFPTTLEARIVDALREAGGITVSQVACLAEKIVGHVLLSPVRVEQGGDHVSVQGLAPLSVIPEFQRRGIGALLMRSALESARELGIPAVVLLGEPQYYARHGFVAAKRFALRCKWPGTDDAFMVIELRAGSLAGSSGLASYHDAFDLVD